MNSHYLALSSLITLFFFLTILPPSYCDDERFVECSYPFDCGMIKNISYPFLSDNRPAYCGREGFMLLCYDDQYPIIMFGNLGFHVLNINKSHHIMTIKRLDLGDNPCPLTFVINTTLDFYNFDYYPPNDINMTLFYGCPSGVSGLDKASFPCSLGAVDPRHNTAYFVNESFNNTPKLLKECHTNIKVPILRTALINESEGGVKALRNVLNQGFDVDYSNAWSFFCSKYEASGGICGSNSSPHPFVCFCRDGDQPLACSSNGLHARFSSHFWIRLKHIFLVLCLVFLVHSFLFLAIVHKMS